MYNRYVQYEQKETDGICNYLACAYMQAMQARLTFLPRSAC